MPFLPIFAAIVYAAFHGRTARFSWALSLACGGAALYSLPVQAQEPEIPLTITEMDTVEINAMGVSAPEEKSPWFIVLSLINVYPKLESEELIRRLYNPAMRLLAPGFQDVRTPGDYRDEHLLWTPEIGIGRILSPRWSAKIYLGYSAGTIRTKAKNPSILFGIPLKTDFEIYRSAAYLGLGANFFPWGMPERKKYSGWLERLRNSKANLGLTLTHTYAGYKVKATAAFAEGPNFLNFEQEDNWWVTSFNANIAADIPFNKRNALSLNAGYSFAFQKGYDFDAAAFTIGWKRYFR